MFPSAQWKRRAVSFDLMPVHSRLPPSTPLEHVWCTSWNNVQSERGYEFAIRVSISLWLFQSYSKLSVLPLAAAAPQISATAPEARGTYS